MNAQADEQWSYVGQKTHQRWLWYAIEATTGVVLSFVFGRRQDGVCEQLMTKLRAFNIKTWRAQKPSATPESCKVLRWENVTNN
jgi:insertion element IS1 protein InsB